jgi:membrane protease YdiL (CAAX protease family)
MKSLLMLFDGQDLFKDAKLKPTIILLSSALFITIHRYFGSIEFAETQSGITHIIDPVIFMFLTAFILFGLIPVLTVKFAFKETLKNYGFSIGNWKFGLGASIILFPLILLLLLYPASQTAEMRSFYPFDRSITSFSSEFVQFQLWRGLLYYLAWEFFFRGFMLFGMRKYVGDWMAICIQLIPQCLWHIGMPTGEIFSSLLGGILFGYLALRTGSILWPFVLHYLIGIGLDALIVLT